MVMTSLDHIEEPAIRRRLLNSAKAAATLLVLYVAAAVVLGLIPVNRAAPVNDRGILVFLRSNGVHAEIAVPIKTDEMDWGTELYQPFVTYGGARPSFVSFGWGDAQFYVETRRFREMRPWSALSALAGRNGSVIHAEHIPGPSSARGDATMVLSPQQYRRLAGYIRDSLQRTPSGLVILATDNNFGHGDRFFVARGSYGPVSTCNEWVRRGLAAAGVRTAAWAPLDWPLFWHARR